MSLHPRFSRFLSTDYLQFVERLLVVGAGGVRWIKNSEPGVQSTVMGAGVDLKYKHGSYKILKFTLIRKIQIKGEVFSCFTRSSAFLSGLRLEADRREPGCVSELVRRSM